MANKLGVIMDPISSIKPYKDSTFAMLLEAQRRQWDIHYMEQSDLYLEKEKVFANTKRLAVTDQNIDWFAFGQSETLELGSLDAVLMRKDPPFDMNYVFSTYLLELAEKDGTLVINKASSLRDANEKLFTLHFPQCTPSTVVSYKEQDIRRFLTTHGDIILKPLDGMGGASIFRVKDDDPNIAVIIETMTQYGNKLIMAQRFIPEISAGDKRILLVDGKPIPYALARIPAKGETRGNLAAGGRGEGVPLTQRDHWICEQVGPALQKMGLLFVGIDVIGDYLTEINVTSPTCIRELDAIYKLNIAGDLFDAIERRLAA